MFFLWIGSLPRYCKSSSIVFDPAGILTIVVLLLAATPLAENPVNAGLVLGRDIRLRPRIGMELVRLKINHPKAIGKLTNAHAFAFDCRPTPRSAVFAGIL
jgi:hypothetical protein